MSPDLDADREARRRLEQAFGLGCLLCGRRDIGLGEDLCGRCRREVRPTPLDIVLYAIGWTEKQLAEATGIPRRTILRASKGIPVGERTAKRLERATGIPWQDFRRGSP